MALEDCEILAMLLAHHHDQEQDGWRLAAKLYSDMRIPRLRWIRKEAEKRSGTKHDMGVAQEMLMYFFIWLSCEHALLHCWRTRVVDMMRRQDRSFHETRPRVECVRCAHRGTESLDQIAAG